MCVLADTCALAVERIIEGRGCDYLLRYATGQMNVHLPSILLL